MRSSGRSVAKEAASTHPGRQATPDAIRRRVPQTFRRSPDEFAHWTCVVTAAARLCQQPKAGAERTFQQGADGYWIAFFARSTNSLPCFAMASMMVRARTARGRGWPLRVISEGEVE